VDRREGAPGVAVPTVRRKGDDVTEALTTRRLTAEKARELTEEVKANAAALWRKLLRLHQGEAHLALGYSSWGEYHAAEFGGSYSHSYKLLDAGRVLEAIETRSSIEDLPANEVVARALAPVLRASGPKVVAEVWEEAVEEHGPTPTHRDVRKVVRRHTLDGPRLRGRKRGPKSPLDEVMADHDKAWSECQAHFKAGELGAALESALLAGRALGRVVRTLDGMSTEPGE